MLAIKLEVSLILFSSKIIDWRYVLSFSLFFLNVSKDCRQVKMCKRFSVWVVQHGQRSVTYKLGYLLCNFSLVGNWSAISFVLNVDNALNLNWSFFFNFLLVL